MHLPSSPRRALGLLAAGTIGLSTALVGVAGVASAEESVTQPALLPTAPVEGTSVPSAPVHLGVFQVGDGSAFFGFLKGSSVSGEQATTTGFEVSTDGGATWAPLQLDPDSIDFASPYVYQLHARVTGLQNKTHYTLSVRATSAAGPSLASEPVDLTPAKPIGAPGAVTATSWEGKVTVVWSAPIEAGSYDLDGYSVDLWNPSLPHGGEMQGPLCETAADELTCTGDLPAGNGWQASVAAIDTEGNYGTGSDDVAVVPGTSAPASASAPAPAPEPDAPAPDAPEAPVEVAQATNVVATTGKASITVTWDPPTASSDHEVAGYRVGWGLGQMGDLACEVAATAKRICTFPAEAGQQYSVSVLTVDAEGNVSDPARVVVSAGVPTAAKMPATVPASDGALERPAGETGSVTAGKKITLRGSGYQPHSSITVAIYSVPQVLTTVFTDQNGSFEVTVTVPAGLAAGEHTLVASGLDADGNVRYTTLRVTVTGGTTGAGGLAYTGADIALPLVGGGVALLIGGGLLVASRRRATA